MITRRQFCVSTFQATAALSLAGVGVARAEARTKEPTRLAALRKQAKHRRRRIIYNSDGNDVNVAGVKTAEDFLAVRRIHTKETPVITEANNASSSPDPFLCE